MRDLPQSLLESPQVVAWRAVHLGDDRIASDCFAEDESGLADAMRARAGSTTSPLMVFLKATHGMTKRDRPQTDVSKTACSLRRVFETLRALHNAAVGSVTQVSQHVMSKVERVNPTEGKERNRIT